MTVCMEYPAKRPYEDVYKRQTHTAPEKKPKVLCAHGLPLLYIAEMCIRDRWKARHTATILH